MLRNMMHPALIFALALGLPLAFALSLFAPLYAGMCVAEYLYYGPDATAYFYDPGYVLELYRALYGFWLEHRNTLGFEDFILPVFAPVASASLIGLWLFYLFARYLRNIFRVI